MIYPVQMYSCRCDNCGKRWEDEENGYVAYSDESSMELVVGEDDEWLEWNGKDYCGKCWSWDEGDEVLLRTVPPEELERNRIMRE